MEQFSTTHRTRQINNILEKETRLSPIHETPHSVEINKRLYLYTAFPLLFCKEVEFPQIEPMTLVTNNQLSVAIKAHSQKTKMDK